MHNHLTLIRCEGGWCSKDQPLYPPHSTTIINSSPIDHPLPTKGLVTEDGVHLQMDPLTPQCLGCSLLSIALLLPMLYNLDCLVQCKAPNTPLSIDVGCWNVECWLVFVSLISLPMGHECEGWSGDVVGGHRIHYDDSHRCPAKLITNC